jgi:hypothetical protein
LPGAELGDNIFFFTVGRSTLQIRKGPYLSLSYQKKLSLSLSLSLSSLRQDCCNENPAVVAETCGLLTSAGGGSSSSSSGGDGVSSGIKADLFILPASAKSDGKKGGKSS